MIDDYRFWAISTEKSTWELLWTPVNEHVIPLYWLELKVLFYFFGTNPPPLNFPLYGAATVAIAGAAVLLRMLRFGPSTLLVFLGIFASTTIVSHQIYGFYALGPYFHALALLMLSLITLVKSQESQRFARVYQVLSLVLLAMSLLIESGAVWAPGTYALFIFVYHILRRESWDIKSVFKAYRETLIAACAIALSYVTYLITLPRYTTEPFYGFSHLPISLNTIIELYRVLVEGVLLSLFAPRLGLVISQPRFAELIMPWHIAMFVLFTAFVGLIAYAVRKGTLRTQVLVPYFVCMTLGTSLLVAIARPSSNYAAFYRDQNLLFPLFFLALAFTVFAHEWVRSATQERTRHTRALLIVAFVAIIFISQHTFSFYKDWYMADIKFNRELVAHMRETLTPALNELSASESITVPSLTPLFLQRGTYHQLRDLYEFSSFIGIRNTDWVSVSHPYGASTSPEFVNALKKDERLREWYLAHGELGEECVAEPFGQESLTLPAEKPSRVAHSVDPTRTHVLYFDLTATNAPEKIFIDLAYGNDFNVTGPRGYIRIDQYTETANADHRRYVCSVNLNEMPAFALSKKVTELTISVTTPGEYQLNGFRLESR